MNAEQNERITRVGPGTPCGQLLRQYWHPVALLDEFDPLLNPAMGERPVKAVRALGQDFVLFKDDQGRFGLLDRGCPHRGADMHFARFEGDGLRCPFHGWKFDANGKCLETPAEPSALRMCDRVKARAYPLQIKAGTVFAWLGEEGSTPPPLPDLDCFLAPTSHSFAFKGMWSCNWLQAFEVGMDPAHASFLHVYFDDEDLNTTGTNAAGRQFRAASAGQVDGRQLPMTKVLREFNQPDIQFKPTDYGFEIQTLRPINDHLTHVRVTHSIFPYTFVIPLSETVTITQMHLPVDDTHTYWYSFFTSFDGPLDKKAMRDQRLKGNPAPDFLPLKNASNQWGYNPQEQKTRTFLGMGEDDINVHDQWACESMGPIADRTKERLGTTDKVIVANRRLLMKAIDEVQAGGKGPGMADATLVDRMGNPDTVDVIAPATGWEAHWRAIASAKRRGAPWTPQVSN